MTLQVLETACEWRAADVADPAAWTQLLGASEIAEVEAAIAHARAKSPTCWRSARPTSPCDAWRPAEGHGSVSLWTVAAFVLIRGLRASLDDDNLCTAYWGIGAHWASLAAEPPGAPAGRCHRPGQGAGPIPRRGATSWARWASSFTVHGSTLVGLMCRRPG